MNEAIAITVVNAVISISLFIGIYKNKIDIFTKILSQKDSFSFNIQSMIRYVGKKK